MVVPYVYQRLGHQAPLLHLRSDGDDEVASFFVANAERVLRDAVPAADIIASQPDRRHIQADWIQACVSIVPDGSAPLYQFGSSVTGFDLRSEAATEQALLDDGEHAECVGDARLEGFHAPLVEPLYFANDAGIDRVAAELSMLAEESPRLTLSNPRVEDRTHTFGGIVLRCDEPSGVAEALHGELVSRVYKRAVTSRYLLNRDMMIGGSESAPGRGSLMIRRYGTPYVFNRFDVHFILSASPPMDPIVRRSLVEQLEDLRREYVPAADVEIDRVYLLVRRPADLHWRIHKAYRLLGS